MPRQLTGRQHDTDTMCFHRGTATQLKLRILGVDEAEPEADDARAVLLERRRSEEGVSHTADSTWTYAVEVSQLDTQC